MKLNLSILAEDLARYSFFASIHHSKSAATLRFAGLIKPEGVLDSSIAYVVTADDLDTIPSARFSAIPSIICIGKPSERYLRAKHCNVIWTKEPLSVAELLEAVSQRFNAYDEWMFSLEQAAARNEPLRRLAELSAPIIKKPIWMWDCHYQTVFSYIDEETYALPESYAHHEDGKPWPIWEINAWRDGGYIDIEATQELKRPYILPDTDLFGYRALAYNLFIESRYAATVTFEEVGTPITDRDYILIERFGSILNQALKRTDLFNITATQDLVKELKNLLANKQVSESKLNASLSAIKWGLTGPFVVAVAKSLSPLYSQATIMATAEKVCGMLTGVTFIVDGQDIVFIINSRIAQGNPLDVAKNIYEFLLQHKYQMTMGVSTPFERLTDLYHYRIQADNAIEVGSKKRKLQSEGYKDSEENCYYFEDYILDFIIDKCTTRLLPETLCPPGLAALIDYDRKNYSDFCITLREYLYNNMQVSETARQLFMHRNSLIMRMKKIEAIMQSDLHDPDVRLTLMLAFKILDSQVDVFQKKLSPHS